MFNVVDMAIVSGKGAQVSHYFDNAQKRLLPNYWSDWDQILWMTKSMSFLEILLFI